jgi:Flp pilus assembly protein TadB
VSRQVWLSQAGAAVTPAQFWGVSVTLGAAAFAALLAVDRTVIVALVPAVGVGAAPYAYWSAQRHRRANARFEAWPDALRHVQGMLTAGTATLHKALVELSISGPEPLRGPMARYVRLADRVGSLPALEAVRSELADPVSDSVLLAFETAATEGTTTVLLVLEGLLGQISGDLALGEKVRTLGTQSRIAAWGSLIMPYVMLVLFTASSSLYRQFYASPVGLAVVISGGCASIAGFTVVRRLGRPIATVERVFVIAAGSDRLEVRQ